MSSIEIRTTQNVTIDYQLAKVGERLLAYVIDGAIFFGGYYLLLFTAASFLDSFDVDQWVISTFLLFVPLFGFIFYLYLTEWLLHGQTVGKRLLGLKVVRIDGLEPVQGDYLLRAIFQLIDSLTTMGIMAILLISSTPRKQRFGDLAANTTVVRIKPTDEVRLKDILAISSLDNYEVRYPAVQQLSEEDMLLIKRTIQRYRRYPNEAHQQAVNELADVLRNRVKLVPQQQQRIEFLETLIRDYIVLTR